MKRLAFKFSALILLSAGYVMASGNMKSNPIKNTTKTNVQCLCIDGDGFTYERTCSAQETCTVCCRPGQSI
jgi:hypothetical protein